MSELLKLAKRCEKAEGPDRALDAAIFIALGMPLPEQFANLPIALQFNDERQAFLADVGDMLVRYEQPAYTACVTTALTLIPTDGSMNMLDLMIGYEPAEPAVWPACTVRWYPAHKTGPDWHAQISSGRTLALAVCAAALETRARAEAGE